MRVVLVCLCLCSACAIQMLAAQVPAPAIEDAAPVLTIVRDTSDSILREQRASGPPLYDFPTRFDAVDVTGWTPMKTTAGLLIDGRNGFWLSPDGSRVGVDQRMFSTLQQVDATSLRGTKAHAVGRLLVAGTPPLLTVCHLLIQADVILTWAHIGSKLTLSNERRVDGFWRVDVSGTHEYYTNERNEDRVAFTVQVDKKGYIVVTRSN